MGVNGGPGVWRRLKEAYSRNWPWSRSTSSRDGSGTVIFASTREVLTFVYRPNLSVRDICTEAAVKVEISPVALDFFTLVTEDGRGFLNPNKVLSESECSQVYFFKLCIKACHGVEIKDLDKKAFEYYFHQCRQDFLSGKIGEFSKENQNPLAQVLLYEIVYLASTQGAHVTTKDVIENPSRHHIKKLLQRGIFADYPLDETKSFLKMYVTQYEALTDQQVKSEYISALERAEDFFVHKFSFEKVYGQVSRKFEVLISAEFGIKKRRLDIENSLPEVIVEKFSDVEGLEFDRMRNVVRILRKECKTEELTASSTQDADSLMMLTEGYYRLMVNQYKQLNVRGSKRAGTIPCHGPIVRKKAEYLLQKGPRENGSFLLRRKRNNHWNHVLSVYVADKVMNYDIIWDDSTSPGFYHLKDAKRAFSDLSGLVQHYKQSADGLPVCLKEILKPKTEGLAALLDRQAMVPAVPEVHLVNDTNKIDNLLVEPGNSLSQRGEFGEVKKGSFCASAEEQLYVVSRALVKPVGREKIRHYKEAMETFLELQNTYLTQFYGITETEKALIFVFEFAAEGPLDQYIKSESTKEKGITKERVISYAAQIAEGMMFLHSKNCVHGRLNAHNVLVANEECIKISDFGLLYLVQNDQCFYHSTRRGHGYCWFSPQSLHEHTFTMESDIWTFGVTLWEMFAMKKPFHCSFTEKVLSEKDVMNRYLERQYLNPDRPNCPPSVGKLIRQCFALKPKDRMSFRELVTELRSPELVSNDQAQDLLLSPEITQLEDWEISLSAQPSNLNLEAVRDGSQASNGDYSCLPENGVQHEVSIDENRTHNLPGIPLISSVSLFDNTTTRKQSLSKTYSHPSLVHAYETDSTLPSREQFNFLPVRKPSITRVSSCPPSIEAGGEHSNEEVELTERQQKERYVTFPLRSAEVNVPSPSQQELQVPDTGVEDPETMSSEEPVESDGSSNEDSSTDDGGAEAMAMRSLAKHLLNTSIHQTSVGSPPPGVDTRPDLLSVFSNDDGDRDEEWIELVSESGSSAYIALESVTSTQSSPPVHHTEEKSEKSRAGSYVTLSTVTKESTPQNQVKGSSILQRSSGAHSTVDNPVVPVQPMQPSVSNAAATSYSAGKSNGLNDENPTRRAPDVSPYQNQQETSQLKDGEFVSVPCKSPDELLGSLSKDVIQEGMGSLALTGLLTNNDDDSFEDEPSLLITDLQEQSEDTNGDFQAELSLGKFSLAVSNVDVELNKLPEELSCSLEEERNRINSQPRTDMELDSAKQSTNNVTRNRLPELDRQGDSTLSEKSQLSLGTFAYPMNSVGLELDNLLDQSFLDPEGEPTNCRLQPQADTELGSANVSGGYISNQELLQRTSTDHTDTTDQLFHFIPGLTNNEDCGEESDPDNEDAGETSDTDLGSLCGSVGHSPEKNKVLNRPFLVFDQGQEEFEMKKFSLNNLSKASLKSTEFPVFKDEHLLDQEISSLCSNQLDDAHNEDGCSLNGDQEAECGVQGNIWVDPGYKDMGDLKETTESTAGTSDGNYIDKEAQLLGNVDGHRVSVSLHGQAPDEATEEEEDEAIASLSRSSSSEGIWPSPDAVQRGYQQRTSTIDSCSSGTDEPPTLDMSKIPQQLQIPYEQLQIHRKLGQGQFGEVNQATIVFTGSSPKREEVAVKVLKDKASAEDSSDFIKEVQNMIELESKQRCKYIIKLRGVAKNPNGKLMLVTELAPLGSLEAYLPKNKDILQTPQLLEFCMQICKGMRYLEQQSLLHKDLAARNILVMREDLVKISDFGLSRLQDYYKLQESSKIPVKWYALESLLKQRFTTKSDVWSFGVTMWEIFTFGEKPYRDMKTSELPGFLEKGQRLARPVDCPQKVYDVMYSCWLKDASKRPTFFLMETDCLAALLKEYPVSG